MQLKPFQKRAIAAALAGLRGPSRTALIVATTGAGKTVMIGGVIQAEQRRRRQRVLVLQHTTTLMDQNHGKIQSLCAGLRFGLLGAGKAKGLAHADVTVATMQSAGGKILDHLPPLDLVVIDEVHHAVAPGYMALFKRMQARNPEIALLGVTATPGRSDGIGLDRLFEAVSYHASFAEVYASGLIVPPRVLSADLDAVAAALGEHVWTDGDDAEASAALRVEVTMAEMVRKHIAHAEGRRAVYFCCDTAHAEALAAQFSSAGLRAVAVSHRMSRAKVRGILADFRAGGLDVVTNPLMLTEGFDDPALGCVGLARGFGSKHLMTQAIGRVIRASPETGKRDGIVLDFVRAASRHGDLFPSLDIVSRVRRGGVATVRTSGEAECVAADAVTMAEVDMLDGLMSRIEIVPPAVPVAADDNLSDDLTSLPRTRVEALAMGSEFYFTGVPCKNGHVAARYISRQCVQCNKESAKRRFQDPEVRVRKAELHRSRWQDPEVRARQAELRRRRFQDPEVRARQAELRRRRFQDPEVRARKAEQDRRRFQDPEVKARQAELRRRRRQDPEVRARQAERDRRRYLLKRELHLIQNPEPSR